MKKILALAASASLMLMMNMPAIAATDAAAPAANSASGSGAVIAIVNVQQVLQQSPRVTAMSNKLKDQFKARQEKLEVAQKSLEEDMDKLKKEGPTMADKDKQAMQKKIADNRASLMKQAVAFQTDVNQEQDKTMKSILSQLNGIISDIAKKNNYTVVLDAQAVVYAADKVDITKQVSEVFNKG